jgi:hypothetical protein
MTEHPVESPNAVEPIEPRARIAGAVRPASVEAALEHDVSASHAASCGCGSPGCRGCAPASASYVYALGSVATRFPSAGVEKEFAQAAREADTANLTDREVVYRLLREHRYLAREVCWLFRVEGLDTYVLTLRDPADLDALVEAVKPTPDGVDRTLVIGTRGPLSDPRVCNGLVVPSVAVDRIYSFDIPSLLESIPKPPGINADAFKTAARELFDRIMHLADNAGGQDEYRAVNYLAVRYPAIYAHTADMFARDAFLSSVDVKSDALSGVRRIVTVILAFTNRKTDVTEKYFVRVDVSEKWPFLVSKLQPYYDR